MLDKNANVWKNFQKQGPGRQGSSLGLPRRGPGGAKSVRTTEELQFLTITQMFGKTLKNKLQGRDVFWGCQVAAPGETNLSVPPRSFNF